MRATSLFATALGLTVALVTPVLAQAGSNVLPAPRPDTTYDPIRVLASRLELERYKATIKGLTQFGDRRQGTDRNANAVTWIETQLKSYGCSNVERIHYDYNPPAPVQRDSAARAAAAAARARSAGQAQGGRSEGEGR